MPKFLSSPKDRITFLVMIAGPLLIAASFASTAFWKIAVSKKFVDLPTYSMQAEANVVGRLSRNDVAGYFDLGGRLSWLPKVGINTSTDENASIRDAVFGTFSLFFDGTIEDKKAALEISKKDQVHTYTVPYEASIGLQGLFYTIIDEMTSHLAQNGHQRLAILQAINLMLTAGSIAFLAWVLRPFIGTIGMLLIFIIAALSYNLSAYSVSLYWVLFKAFLVLALPGYIFAKTGNNTGSPRSYILGMALPICLIGLTGFEFISTYMIEACLLPVAFGLGEGGITLGIRRGIYSSFACIAGLMMAFGIHILVMTLISGNLYFAAQGLMGHAALNTILQEPGAPSRLGTIWIYLTDKNIFRLKVFYPTIGWRQLRISMGSIILITTGLFIVLQAIAYRIQISYRYRMATFFLYIGSIIAPISWFFLAYEHATRHAHIIGFLWSMPTALLCPALTIGLAITVIEHWTRRSIARQIKMHDS